MPKRRSSTTRPEHGGGVLGSHAGAGKQKVACNADAPTKTSRRSSSSRGMSSSAYVLRGLDATRALMRSGTVGSALARLRELAAQHTTNARFAALCRRANTGSRTSSQPPGRHAVPTVRIAGRCWLPPGRSPPAPRRPAPMLWRRAQPVQTERCERVWPEGQLARAVGGNAHPSPLSCPPPVRTLLRRGLRRPWQP